MIETLCWQCEKSCTDGCSWSKDFVPVNGWVAENNEKTGSYSVLSCPQFVSGRKKIKDLDIDGAKDLVAGIIRLAVQDYRNIPEKRHSIEMFFRGKFFAAISDIDPEKLIKLLRNEVWAKKAPNNTCCSSK